MNEEKNHQNSILFVDSSISLDEIINVKEKNPDTKIFCFDYHSHKLLEKQKIPHKISDDFLSESDLDLLQESSYEFAEWYTNSKIKQLQNYEQIDLGSLYKIEFFVFLLPFVKKFFEIKNIISSNQNSTLYASNQLHDISSHFKKNLASLYGTPSPQIDFFYDTLQFENNLFHIELSQKSFQKNKKYCKQIFESFFQK